MENMQNTVEDRRDHNRQGDKEYQPRVKGVTAGKDLPGIGLWHVYRPHTPENH